MSSDLKNPVGDKNKKNPVGYIKKIVENKIVYGWRWAECEGSAKIHASHELENKMDKKSVHVRLANSTTKKFTADGNVSYDFQIGEHNGCLLIVEKREVDSVISVPDEEDIFQAYSAQAWLEAELVE